MIRLVRYECKSGHVVYINIYKITTLSPVIGSGDDPETNISLDCGNEWIVKGRAYEILAEINVGKSKD